MISQKAKNLQKEFHPDKNHNLKDKQKIEEYSAYINDAKNTLADDLKRAVYLMKLKGIDLEEESKIEDAEFMTDMFELQEQIQSADTQKAQQIKRNIEIILLEIRKDLEEFFNCEDLDKCRQFIFKYKYLHRALQNVKIKIE